MQGQWKGERKNEPESEMETRRGKKWGELLSNEEPFRRTNERRAWESEQEKYMCNKDQHQHEI